MKSLTVDRATLFEEVWSLPMYQLAKRYGMSDVGLSNVCRRLNIPMPERGYFVRLANGNAASKPRLPKLSKSTPATVTITPSALRPTDSVPTPVPIPADAFTRILHPIASTAKATFLTKRREDLYGIDPLHRNEIARERAFRLLSGLMYSLEDRGYSIQTGRTSITSFVAIVDAEPLRISLSASVCGIPGFKWPGSVKLTLTIEELMWSGYHRNWSDGTAIPIEEKIAYFIDGLERMQPLVRKEREERDRQQAIEESQRAARALVVQRRQQLAVDLEGHSRAQAIWNLIADARAEVMEEGSIDSRWTAWLQWATEEAKQADPLGKGASEFFRRYGF